MPMATSAIAPGLPSASEPWGTPLEPFFRGRKEDYVKLSTLGYGSQATVRLGRHRPTGKLVAVKTIDKKDCPLSLSCSPGSPVDKATVEAVTAADNVINEARILGCDAAGHPNIPHLYDFFESENRYYVVLEYCQGVDLETFLGEHPDGLSETQAIPIITTLLYTIAYLHSKGIVHRDLKPANIILRDAAHDPGNLALIDFGSAFTVGRKQPRFASLGIPAVPSTMEALRTICGTPFYIAPELVRGVEYTAKVDVWGLGCLAYTLLCGVSPFHDAGSFDVLYKRILHADFGFPEHCHVSSEAQSFIRYLLNPDPHARPTAGQALAHVWVSPHEFVRSSSFVRRRRSGVQVEFSDGSLRCSSEAPKASSSLPRRMFSFMVGGHDHSERRH
ncbi:kinase-like domain-containing protein [Hyaloraphidium curvatum]|nr:kinase-like domain-containing protein [Hyaloraphidium curvatum]